jgi:DNA polymerase III epsilon subunit family exonuclease
MRQSNNLRSFVSADTETTGFSPVNGDRIVEIAMLRFVDGEVVSKFVSFVHPQRSIPPYVTAKVHGITDEMVAQSPSLGEILPRMVGFAGDDPVVFHNAEFDMRFLETESMLAGAEWPSHIRVFDTLEIARRSGLFSGSHKLGDLARSIGLVQKFHRAEADAYAVGKLLLHLMKNGAPIEPWT